MTDLTAIDILINPDDAAVDRARTLNERIRCSVPDGLALDATHAPHITTQRQPVLPAARTNRSTPGDQPAPRESESTAQSQFVTQERLGCRLVTKMVERGY